MGMLATELAAGRVHLDGAADPLYLERYVELPGFSCHLREAGDGDALVLLHGWPQHGGMWEPAIEEFAGELRVLAPDMRGFGRSEAPAGDYTKHALAADVLALLDAEGIERATIVGHDWGGWIAWLLALEHPDRVERFAALDAPPPVGAASLQRLPLQVLFATYQVAIASPIVGERLVRSRAAVRRFIRAATGSRARLSDALLEDYAEHVTGEASARASVALYRSFLVRELPAVARGTYTSDGELRVPGLVIMGAESPVTRTNGVPDARPGLAVEVIPGAGHFLLDEVPAGVLELLREFLNG